MSAVKLGLLLCACAISVALAQGSNRSRDGRELARFLTAEFDEALPNGRDDPERVARRQQLQALSVIATELSFYAIDVKRTKEAVSAALASNGAQSSPTTIAEIIVDAVVSTLGHGAKRMGASREQASETERSMEVSATRHDDLWVVTLPHLRARPESPCDDFHGLFSVADDSITSVVLDLRNNSGGLLTSVACIAAEFLPGGTDLFEIVETRATTTVPASNPLVREPSTLPVVIIIDERTDSGGLLLAATLQDHDRARIIGEQRADIMGDVTSLFPLDRLTAPTGYGIAVALPVGTLTRIQGRPLADGVRLDAEVPSGDDAALLAKARQLVHAERPAGAL